MVQMRFLVHRVSFAGYQPNEVKNMANQGGAAATYNKLVYDTRTVSTKDRRCGPGCCRCVQTECGKGRDEFAEQSQFSTSTGTRLTAKGGSLELIPCQRLEKLPKDLNPREDICSFADVDGINCVVFYNACSEQYMLPLIQVSDR